jgi:hypothetical protein
VNSNIVQYIGIQYEQDLIYLQQQQQQQQNEVMGNSTTSMDYQSLDVEEKQKYIQNLRLPIYQGEDISLGIWISDEVVLHEAIPKNSPNTILNDSNHDSTFYIDSPYFTNDYHACYDIHDSFSIGHDLSPDDIQECYNYQQQQQQQIQSDSNGANYQQRQIHEMKHIWYLQSLSHKLNEDDTNAHNPNRKKKKKKHNNQRIQENWGSIARQQSKQAEIEQRQQQLERSKFREQLRQQKQQLLRNTDQNES